MVSFLEGFGLVMGVFMLGFSISAILNILREGGRID
jgi:hypothetical protein